MAAKMAQPCLRFPIIVPNSQGQGHGYEQDDEHFQEVGQAWGSRRDGGIGVEEAAAVGAELLDGHLGCGGSHGDDLFCPSSVWLDVGAEGLHHAL